MTPTEFRAIARRRGIVKWLLSGRIEVLRLVGNGTILARSLTEREHPIHNITGQSEYRCVELDPKQSVAWATC